MASCVRPLELKLSTGEGGEKMITRINSLGRDKLGEPSIFPMKLTMKAIEHRSITPFPNTRETKLPQKTDTQFKAKTLVYQPQVVAPNLPLQ